MMAQPRIAAGEFWRMLLAWRSFVGEERAHRAYRVGRVAGKPLA